MHLTLHLTTACNMRCSYCYAPPRPGPRMTLDVARRALALGAADGARSCGVVFFGGEPLLERELIAQIVAEARAMERTSECRYHFKITTNGVLLDDAFLDFCVREDLLVALSCDGTAAAHDAHRRLASGKPSHVLVRSRLERLLAFRPYSSVLLVVRPDTARYLTRSVSELLDLGCRYLIVSLDHAAPWSRRSLALLRREYRALARLYVRWTRAGRKFYLSPFEVKLSSHINRHCYHKDRCELASRQLSVDPAGYLFPCVQFTRAGADSAWCVGHVASGIDEPARRRIREQSEAEKASCRGCALQERCNNTCGCLNWQSTGSTERVSPLLCAHERMLIPIADRIGAALYDLRDSLFLHKHYDEAYPVLSAIEDAMFDEEQP